MKDYKSIIENKSIKQEKNINLQMNGNQMSKLTVQNNALTGLHTKMIVLENQSCCPYISGLTSKDYIIEWNEKLIFYFYLNDWTNQCQK